MANHEMPAWRKWLLIAATAAIGAAAVGWSFRSDIRNARENLEGRSKTIRTADGAMEYAVAGSGPPLLMIHGTGGGFDQGLLFTEKLAAKGVKVIAPSRFGYLRSSFPADHSSEAQADAFVALLDHLKLDKVVIAGGSAGALSAVQFALRHPERTRGLILIVPAANVEGHDPNEMSPSQEWLVRELTKSDFLYWTARQVAPKQLIGFLLATDPALLEKVSAEARSPGQTPRSKVRRRRLARSRVLFDPFRTLAATGQRRVGNGRNRPSSHHSGGRVQLIPASGQASRRAGCPRSPHSPRRTMQHRILGRYQAARRTS